MRRDSDFLDGFVVLVIGSIAFVLHWIVKASRWILIGALLAFGALLVNGAFFQDEMPATKTQSFTPSPAVPTPTGDIPVAVCPECYYREPTPEELEFAERTWQEWWGEMELQEFVNGAVLEK